MRDAASRAGGPKSFLREGLRWERYQAPERRLDAIPGDRVFPARCGGVPARGLAGMSLGDVFIVGKIAAGGSGSMGIEL